MRSPLCAMADWSERGPRDLWTHSRHPPPRVVGRTGREALFLGPQVGRPSGSTSSRSSTSPPQARRASLCRCRAAAGACRTWRTGPPPERCCAWGGAAASACTAPSGLSELSSGANTWTHRPRDLPRPFEQLGTPCYAIASPEAGRRSATFGLGSAHRRTEIGPIWPDVGQISSALGHTWPMLADASQIRLISTSFDRLRAT